MSTVFARNRSREAPMQGLEFTNRSNTVPAWRLGANQSQSQNQITSSQYDNQNVNPDGTSNNHTALKRTHSIANPPASPFTAKGASAAGAAIPRPVFGENIQYLFRPPETSTSAFAQQSPSASTWLNPVHEAEATPEIDMRDVEITPPRPIRRNSKGGANKELGRGEDRNGDTEGESEDEEDGDGDTSFERRIISNAAVRRIARRRKQGGKSGRRAKSRLGELVHTGNADGTRGEYSSDDEDYNGRRGGKGHAVAPTTSNHYTLNMAGPAPPKNETPYVLLGYLQFCFNLSLVLVFLYLLVQFIFTVQKDVQERIGEQSMEIIQEISTCATHFKQNLCDTTPIPAMLAQCSAWELCMSRDPRIVGRARVGAEMLAEVINGFVEPISWKTLLFTLSSLAFMTVFVNTLLSLYRHRMRNNLQHQSTENKNGQPMHVPMPIPPPIGYPPFPHAGYGYLPAPHHTQGVDGGRWLGWQPQNSVGELDALPRQRRRLENGTDAEAKAE